MERPELNRRKLLPGLRVADVMRRDFEMIDGMNTIRDVLLLLAYRPAHCLVVHKRHDADEYGVLLVSDIGRKVLALGRAPQRVNVYEVMAKPAITVPAEMAVDHCARLLQRCAISLAPAVDEDGGIVGIASLNDLVLNGLLPRVRAGERLAEPGQEA
ncbi:MAG TPA: CBS domain-containing protein [Gammaproteobacteria bacterium]